MVKRKFNSKLQSFLSAFCTVKQIQRSGFWHGQQSCVFRITIFIPLTRASIISIPTFILLHRASSTKHFILHFNPTSHFTHLTFSESKWISKAETSGWLWEPLSLWHKVNVRKMTGFQGCQTRVSLEGWRCDGVLVRMRADRHSPIGRKLSDWWVFSGRLLSWTWFRHAGWLPHLSLLLWRRKTGHLVCSLKVFWTMTWSLRHFKLISVHFKVPWHEFLKVQIQCNLSVNVRQPAQLF